MTEYIITEEQLKDMERTGLSQLASKFRSHPYNPQAAPCPQNKVWDYCPVSEQIRQAGREKVLDLLKEWVESKWIRTFDYETGTVRYCDGGILDKIEELREGKGGE